MGSGALKVGVIGTGFGARVHIPVLKATPGIEVVAVASAHKERAEKVARKFDIPFAFDDYRKLVLLPDLNLVSVVTPPNLHYPVTLAAIEAGKHVLCEKPMAMDAEESRIMLSRATEKGIIHLMNFEFRTTPAHQKMKDLIDEGYLGQVHLVHVSIITGIWQEYGHMFARWWFRRETGGGWLGALGSHFIDALRYWFGEIVGVSAQLSTLVKHRKVAGFDVPQDADADDTFHLLLRFENEAIGVFSSSAVIHTPGSPRIAAYGSDGTLVLEGDCLYGAKKGQNKLVEIPVAENKAAVDVNLLDPHYIPFSRWAKMIAEALPGGVQLSPSFEDGLRCQEVMDAARRSSAEGKWIEV